MARLAQLQSDLITVTNKVIKANDGHEKNENRIDSLENNLETNTKLLNKVEKKQETNTKHLTVAKSDIEQLKGNWKEV